MIYIDTETTGFDQNKDDILSIAIIAEDGETLYSSMFRPTRKTSWPEAMRVNNITPEMVQDKPTIDEKKYLIEGIIKGQDVCCYNSAFDMSMLTWAGEKGIDTRFSGIYCCMERWAIWKGEPSSKPYHTTGYRTHKLTEAAAEIGYIWTDRAHGAEADARACRAIWEFLSENKAPFENHPPFKTDY